MSVYATLAKPAAFVTVCPCHLSGARSCCTGDPQLARALLRGYRHCSVPPQSGDGARPASSVSLGSDQSGWTESALRRLVGVDLRCLVGGLACILTTVNLPQCDQLDTDRREFGGPVEINLLGGLEVLLADHKLHLGTPKQRVIFAMLAVRPGQLVTLASLIDELWADRPPRSAVANVRTYAANLRREFETLA